MLWCGDGGGGLLLLLHHFRVNQENHLIPEQKMACWLKPHTNLPQWVHEAGATRILVASLWATAPNDAKSALDMLGNVVKKEKEMEIKKWIKSRDSGNPGGVLDYRSRRGRV